MVFVLVVKRLRDSDQVSLLVEVFPRDVAALDKKKCIGKSEFTRIWKTDSFSWPHP